VLQFLGLPQLHLNDQPIAIDRRKAIAMLAYLYINNTREGHRPLKQADLAIPCARRLITLNPLNESAHRQLMGVYLQAGQHRAALKQYQTCRQTWEIVNKQNVTRHASSVTFCLLRPLPHFMVDE